ncbi:BTAD domain-containing putative transcriptional regulator [Streptomyces sp. B6B3]|uniref:AfsR/SARP family transcriptional regulator n=1 Tax=Streptomyces sp. B6B3 TaxID=3153570 RepID=UPI00325CDC2A
MTAPLPRATLAALALRVDRPVAADLLVGQLWGADRPADARVALRGHVARLRRALPGGAIHTVPGGYRLALAPGQTDVGRFEEALRRARERAAAAPAEAVAMLDAALALWRGAPLGDLRDCPLRAAEGPRLRELCLTALEERFALRLALGDPAALAAELAAAVRAHPDRPRLAEHLLRARGATEDRGPGDGRVAGAAAGDRTAARTDGPSGATEGRGPGGERDGGSGRGADASGGERAAARADGPSGVAEGRGPGARTRPREAPAAGEAPQGPALGAAFPAAVSTFVARGVELARIRGWLTGALAAPAICLIDGPGGVGKSTLAVRAATEVADRFPDGLLYVDLRGADPRNPPLETAEAGRQLLASLGTPGKEIPQQAAAAAAFYQEQLHGRRVLLLLDNALDVDQVAPLLPAEPGSAALVTSRATLTGLGRGHHLHLSTLSSAEAVALVRAVVGDGAPEAAADWAELVALCGHLPLALRILATRMAARPDWRLADWIALLRDERDRMDQLAADDLDLRTSLLVSIDQLAAGSERADRLAAETFPLLGAAAVRCYGAGSVAALVGCSARAAGLALERLTDARITCSPRPGVYTLHDLVRAAAAWQAARLPAGRVAARLTELARWYLGSLYRLNAPLALAERYRRRYREGADRYPQGRLFTSVAESLPWADEALDDVLSLAHQLAGPEHDEGTELGGRPLSAFALEAVRALETYFGMRLSWRAQTRLCEIALEAGRRRDDPFAQAVAWGQLGKAAGQRGQGMAGAAMLHRSDALFRSLGEREEALAVTMNMVPCLGSAGRLTEAVALAERALAETLEAGLVDLAVQIINNLGRCHLFLGNHAEAHRLLRANYESTELPYEKTIAAGVLAEYHLEIGEFEQAARWADRGLSHAAEQPFDPFVMAQHRTWLAAALRGLGREGRARAEEMQAQAILEDLNSRENSHLRVRVEERYSTT